MKIVFIHGAHQQNIDAIQLEQYWLNIFQLGLKQSDLEMSLDGVDVSVPYYGDLLLQHTYSHVPVEQVGFTHAWQSWHLPFLPQNPPQAIQDDQTLISLLTQDQQQLNLSSKLYLLSHLAKDRLLKEFVMLLSKFPKLHESVIQKLIIEAYLYLANPEFMQDVHDRIAASFDRDEDYIVVAHSLGTIVAYNLLQQLKHIRVQRFITLASPLAFRVIQSKLINPITRPNSLTGDWFNFYSHEDYLSTFPLEHSPFNFQPAIVNQGISTFVHKPHEILGYLQHPSVIQSIIDPIFPSPMRYLDYG